MHVEEADPATYWPIAHVLQLLDPASENWPGLQLGQLDAPAPEY